MSIINRFLAVLNEYYQDAMVFLFILSIAWVIIYRFVAPPITYLMVQQYLTSIEGNLGYDWVDYNDISPYMKVSVMASEDQNLPFHEGIDLEALQKAMAINKKGKKVYGASTITQQVAKNVFLFPNRSFFRKGLELYFTFLIELFWSKEKVLEMYLNVAEMGPMTFGVGAASAKYFKKSPEKLSLNESALIVAVLPNPRKYSVKSPGAYVSGRKQEIVSMFYQLDGENYLRELYINTDKSLYDFSKYKK